MADSIPFFFVRSILKVFSIAVKQEAKLLLEPSTNLYLGISAFGLGYRGWPINRVVTIRSEICIEGFPRSANSYARVAFLRAQQRPVDMGNHLHSIANVRRGVDFGIPVLVIVRDPRDAVLSLLARVNLEECPLTQSANRLLIRVLARRYYKFHARLLPLLDRVCITTFDEVVRDFSAVIEKINADYGTTFSVLPEDVNETEEIFRTSPSHLSPDVERTRVKKSLLAEWEKLSTAISVRRAETAWDTILDNTVAISTGSLAQKHSTASTSNRTKNMGDEEVL